MDPRLRGDERRGGKDDGVEVERFCASTLPLTPAKAGVFDLGDDAAG